LTPIPEFFVLKVKISEQVEDFTDHRSVKRGIKSESRHIGTTDIPENQRKRIAYLLTPTRWSGSFGTGSSPPSIND